MKNNESPDGFMHCTCLACDQKVEFPAHGVGTTIDCPGCGKRLRLYDGAIYHPLEPIKASGYDWSIWKRGIAWRGLLNLVGLLVVVVWGFWVVFLDKDDNSTRAHVSISPANSAGTIDWDRALRKSEHDLYGTKVETDEEIHREAMQLQKENAQGIGPDGMLIREMEGRNDP
jgi:hypothetical protein